MRHDRLVALVAMALLLAPSAVRAEADKHDEGGEVDPFVLAMVALTGADPLPTARVRTAMEKVAGAAVKDFKEEKGICSGSIGDQSATVSHMPVPIPWEDLEGPCETSWMWKDATAVMKAHRSHLLVVASGGDHSKLARCLLLTRVIAAMCEGEGVAGVYWGSGTVVIPPETFVRANKTGEEDGIVPVLLWIDFRVQKNEGGTVDVLTTGLSEFGKPEIEVLGSKRDGQEVLELLFDLVPYLLKTDDVIKDGETVGRSEEEKLRVHYVHSKWDREGNVMKIEY